MTSVARANRQAWLIGILAAVAILGLGLSLAVGFKQMADNGDRQRDTKNVTDQLQRDLACVETYANAQYQRSVYIQEYLQPRNDAFADLELAIALNKPKATIDHLRRVFIAADAKYRQVSADQPLPTPPQFVCEGITSPQTPKAGLPTVPSSPSPTPSRPHVAPVPSQDASVTPTTRPRPGPPLTRTATRTAPAPTHTRTVTQKPPKPSQSSSGGHPKGGGGLIGGIPVVGPIVCASPGLGGLPLVCE